MYNSNMLTHPGIIAFIIIMALLLFVMLPIIIVRARKSSKTAKSYIPDLIRMSGLQQSPQNDFMGTYKGFPAILRMGVGTNYAAVGFEMMSGGRNFHGRNMVFQKFSVEMDLPTNIQPLVLKEKVGILRTDQYLMDKFGDKDIELPEIKTQGKLKRVRIFGESEYLGNKLSLDPELQALIANWHYTDIRIGGNKLLFTMDDNMANPTFGPNRVAKPQWIIDGLNIAARTAALVSS